VSDKARTPKQNNSIHKYCSLLSDAFNQAGLDMKAVLKPEVDIPWTTESVKNHIWRPIQEIMVEVESTTELSTTDVDAIYQVVAKHLAEKHGISVAFPSHFTQGQE
jgi:hypothetical protein